MKTAFAFKSAGLVALTLALAGCMGVDGAGDTQEAELNAGKLKFVQETSYSAANAAGINVSANAENDAAIEQIRSLGCPNLADFFDEMKTFQGTETKPFPGSAKPLFACFGINGSGTLDDIDVVYEKLADLTTLLDCVCGSNALSQLLGGKIELFSVQAAAAAEAFDVTNSQVAAKFDASKSKAADTYGSN